MAIDDRGGGAGLAPGLLAFGGFAVLTAALLEAGDRVLSMLGFAATIIFTVRHTAEQALSATGLARVLYTSSAMPAELGPRLRGFLFLTGAVGLACGGLATGLYATALPKLGLGKTGCRVIAAISFAAAAHIVVAWIAGVVFHVPMRSVFGIPAIPFVLPYFMGVSLLRRVGDADDVLRSTAAA